MFLIITDPNVNQKFVGFFFMRQMENYVLLSTKISRLNEIMMHAMQDTPLIPLSVDKKMQIDQF